MELEERIRRNNTGDPAEQTTPRVPGALAAPGAAAFLCKWTETRRSDDGIPARRARPGAEADRCARRRRAGSPALRVSTTGASITCRSSASETSADAALEVLRPWG